jgi:erythromycin esterase
MKTLLIPGLWILLGSSFLSAQPGSPWEKWIRENSRGISLSDTVTFHDLTFLKRVLKDKRIVFLGENSHGVSEFTTLKSRMVRFLHDSLGFNVLAFESNLGDAYFADAQMENTGSRLAIYNSLSSLWHVEEIVPLINYIRSSRRSKNPLVVSGVDFQASNGSYTFSRFLYNLVRPVDPEYAGTIRETDSTVTRAIVRAWTMFSVLDKNEIVTNMKKAGAWLSFYSDLKAYIERNGKLKGVQPRDLKVAAYCVQDRIDCLHHGLRDSAYMAGKLSECTNVTGMGVGKLWSKYRDYKMAEHLKFLQTELYPGSKIIVWAQDSHIARRRCHMADSAYSAQAYSIAFRSFSGKGCYVLSKSSAGAKPQRPVYKVRKPTDSLSIEKIMHSAGRKVSFVDMLHQEKSAGNSWMFEKSTWTQWAGNEVDEETNIRKLFDAFILVDKISPPRYMKIEYEYLK